MTLNKFSIPVGASKTFSITASDSESAINVGSGSLEVFATPAMIAQMEKASLETVADYLSGQYTTVGIKLDIVHLKASKIGAEIRFESKLIKSEDRKLTFEVAAFEKDKIIGKGTHERFIVEKEKFMLKLN